MKSGEGSFLHSVEQMIDDAIERMDLAAGLVDQVYLFSRSTVGCPTSAGVRKSV